MKNQNLVIIIILIIILAGGALFLFSKHEGSQGLNNTDSNVSIIENINSNSSINFNNNNVNIDDNVIVNNKVPEEWQTVSSDVYDYQISFPEEWYVSKGNEKHNSNTDVPVTDISASPNQCYFNGNCITSSDLLVTVQVSNMVCDTSIECANYLDFLPGCAVYSDRQEITVDGHDAAMQYEYPEDGCATDQFYSNNVFIKKGDDTYKISGSTLSKEDFENYSDIFDQIIKTLKFE